MYAAIIWSVVSILLSVLSIYFGLKLKKINDARETLNL